MIVTSHTYGEEIEVSHLQMASGKTLHVPLDPIIAIAAYSSADAIVSPQLNNNTLHLTGSDFGTATVSVFDKSGIKRLYHVTVTQQHLEFPPDLNRSLQFQLKSQGSRGKIGTRLGYRSQSGLFENLILQEEFFSFLIPGRTQHSTSIKVSRPLLYSRPKPDRTIDAIHFQHLKRDGLSVRLGDHSPFIKGWGQFGPVRGARLDYQKYALKPFAFGGILRTGVENFLYGSDPSSIGGAGFQWKLSPYTSLQGHWIGFDQNSALNITESGYETHLQWRYGRGWLSEFMIQATSDKFFKTALAADASLSLSPFSLHFAASHSPSNLGVYSQPNRFGPRFDSYVGELSWMPERLPIQLGASAGKTLSFAYQDPFPGQTEQASGTIHLSSKPISNLTVQAFANTYQSTFTPYAEGTINDEDGESFNLGMEYLTGETIAITAAYSYSQIRSTGFQINYQKRDYTLGYKIHFSNTLRDFIHLETGLSDFDSNEQQREGQFLLTRLALQWQPKYLALRSTLQSESKLKGEGDAQNIRAQLALVFSPNEQHELGLNIYYDLDWVRNIFTNTKGFAFHYIFHFGSAISKRPFFASLRKTSLSGRIYIDENGNGKFEPSDTPLPNVKINLSTTDTPKILTSNKDGYFETKHLPQGPTQLKINRSQISIDAKLASPSTHHLNLTEEHQSIDFRFSTLSQVSGIIFNDANQNGHPDTEDPILENIKLEYKTKRRTQWQPLESPTGEYLITDIPPGEVKLRIDPNTLPPGYRLDTHLEQKLKAKENQFYKIHFPLMAQRTISGIAFKDSNKNRKFDPGEKKLDGLVVHYNNNQTKTGNGGKFFFQNLPASQGKVRHKNNFSEPVQLGTSPTQIINLPLPIENE